MVAAHGPDVDGGDLEGEGRAVMETRRLSSPASGTAGDPSSMVDGVLEQEDGGVRGESGEVVREVVGWKCLSKRHRPRRQSFFGW